MRPPLEVTGRTITLTALAVCLAMSAFAWWFQYGQSRQAAEFWGADAAHLLVGQADVAWLELGDAADGEDSQDAEQLAGRRVTATTDLADKPGLVHFRHALTQDSNFDWSGRRTLAVDAGDDWPHALRFRQGENELVVLVGPQFGRIGKLSPDGRSAEMLPCPRMAGAMQQYLRDVGVLLEAPAARQ